MNMSYHKDFLEHPHSSIYSENTAGSNTYGEVAVRVNPWRSIVNEPVLMILNLKENQSII